MLRVATPANELLWLDHARLMTASQLETLCRDQGLLLEPLEQRRQRAGIEGEPLALTNGPSRAQSTSGARSCG